MPMSFQAQRHGIRAEPACKHPLNAQRRRSGQSRRCSRQTSRCQAQGNNNTFDQFLQWGRGLLKKTLGPSQPQRPSKEAGLPSPSRTEPENARSSMENLISSEESTSSSESLEDQEPAEVTMSAHMEERNSEFRHMAMTGEEITEEWPPPGTPTWSQWLEALAETSTLETAAKDLDDQIESAVDAEDYAAAADARAEMDEIFRKDTVGGLIEEYNTAVQTEDFKVAARLRDEAAISLRGWWHMQSSSAENPGHLLRIRQAFDRYVLLAYSPQDIANIHGITTNMLDRSYSGYDPSPSSRVYDEHCTPVAELNFKRFPDIQADSNLSEDKEKLWSLACAFTDMDESEEAVDMQDDELTATVSAIEMNEDEGQSFEEELDIMTAEDVIEIDDQQLNIIAGMPLSDAVESIQTFSASEEVVIPDYPPMQQDLQRVPAHITRFENDRDRFLLTVAPTNRDLPQSDSDKLEDEDDEEEASSSGSDSGTDEPTADIRVTQLSSDKALTKQDIMEKMNAMLAERRKNDDSGLPSKVLAFKFSIKSENLKKQIEELAKEIKDIRKSGKTEVAADVLRKILESMQMLKEDAGSPDHTGYGLKGTSCYKRLPTERGADPFTGLFIGTFGAHGPEIIQLQRTTGEDMRTYVEGTKLTGDDNVPAGHVAFKAAIGSKESIPGYTMYPPDLGVRVGYKGKGRVAKAKYTEPRWVDGALLQFQSKNPFSQGADLGFIYNMGVDNKLMIFLHRICLDDPAAMEL